MKKLTIKECKDLLEAVNAAVLYYVDTFGEEYPHVKGGVFYYGFKDYEFHRKVGYEVKFYQTHLEKIQRIHSRLLMEKQFNSFALKDVEASSVVLHELGVFALSGLPSPISGACLLNGLLSTVLHVDPDFVEKIVTLSDIRELFLKIHLGVKATKI